MGASLRKGEVHALVSEDSAGKSTFLCIIIGLEKLDTGEMLLKVQCFSTVNRAETEQSGVRMVMQELNLICTLTIAEAIYIRTIKKRTKFVKPLTSNQRHQLRNGYHLMLTRTSSDDRGAF
ncbi:MAG: ATP-binding cassette domain-containing protein [Pyrinomonadaceae bacterium]